MKHPSCREIAASFDLWGEYVDPEATWLEADFEAMPFEKRLALIHELFPSDCTCQEIVAIQNTQFDKYVLTCHEALRFALDKILYPFSESDLYQDYAADENGFTDERYNEMLVALEKLAEYHLW